MYLDLLKASIQENYAGGPEAVFKGVEAWLRSRGFRENDFEDLVFISKEKLSILMSASEELDRLHANGVDNWEGYDL